MVFSSPLFLYGFLPSTLAAYYLSPRKWRNAVLLLFSLIFYGWGEPICILLMLASILWAYLWGFPIVRLQKRSPRWARWAAVASVLGNLSVLIFFKYTNFFLQNLGLQGIEGLVLPIGISFYTFQILSYTVDLYRGEIPLQRDLISFGTYVTLFPQLVAGPIVRYCEIDGALRERRETVTQFASGVARFCCGLGKKILLGDALWAGYNALRQYAVIAPTTLGAWLTAILFTLHLYYDFSGYSDMAIGLGRMFGFSFPENFRYPYVAKSITEFWRRWHITLSSWFRQYVYIPLGGNRRGRWKQSRNLAIVWLLTGLWHGASWNFVLWGAYFCVILICEHFLLKDFLKHLPAAAARVYTLLLVVVSFAIFSSGTLAELVRSLRAMVGVGVLSFADETVVYRLTRLLPLLLISAVGATPLPLRLWNKTTEKRRAAELLLPVASAVVLVLCTAYLADDAFRPFAYLNF
ncbi:MAG: MBOAT family protein [Ruminococcaceae bacterium]|nr:MBOAT family protein [Oscillospiraceae bacterium]